PEKRKKVFLSISAYFFICVLVFIVFIIRIGTGLISLNSLKKETLSLENRLNQGQPQRDISEYNEELRLKITSYLNKLNAIDGVLSKTTDTTELLQRISKPLPKRSYIDDFNLDNDKKTINFNVVSPVGENEQEINLSDIIALWKKDQVLMSIINQINSSQSKREKKGQDSVLISQFSCTLDKKGL
ncbi:MAG: hypothetical protein ABIA97_04065, partial [Candidatus Omnitrophota bacterium]